MSLSTCEKCGGHIPLGPDESNKCEECGEHIFGPWDCPDGCTPADAMVLRRANHALAAESEKYQTALMQILVRASTIEMAWEIAHEATKEA